MLKFNDFLCFSDTVHDRGSLFGIDARYLQLFMDLVDNVNVSNQFDESCKGLVGLLRSYFRHLNTLNLLTQYGFPHSSGNEVNVMQDTCRVSFEVSVYLYYLFYDLSSLNLKSMAYRLSAYQTVARFFQHFDETSYFLDDDYLSMLGPLADFRKYLLNARWLFVQALPHAKLLQQFKDCKNSACDGFNVFDKLWCSRIDKHKWYDDGTGWNSFYSLVSGLSESNQYLMDNYYLVYRPCCASIHSEYSSNSLNLVFPGNYPQVTTSDQDLSASWACYFESMIVWISHQLMLRDPNLSSYFSRFQMLFNCLSDNSNDIIILNNGSFSKPFPMILRDLKDYRH